MDSPKVSRRSPGKVQYLKSLFDKQNRNSWKVKEAKEQSVDHILEDNVDCGLLPSTEIKLNHALTEEQKVEAI